jgi:hypothetical protein
MAERPYDDSDEGLPAMARIALQGLVDRSMSAERAEREILDALAAAGWRKMRGIIRFDGTMTPEQMERFRVAWERAVSGRPWAYEVVVTRTPWWRRVLRWLRGESGEVTTRRPKRGGYTGGLPASEVGPPSQLPSGSTGGQHG